MTQPNQTKVNYRQIEKDILDEVMGPKVGTTFALKENYENHAQL